MSSRRPRPPASLGVRATGSSLSRASDGLARLGLVEPPADLLASPSKTVAENGRAAVHPAGAYPGWTAVTMRSVPSLLTRKERAHESAKRSVR